MDNKIEKIQKKILKEYPERYYKIKPDKYSDVVITDILNTEPVCLIYGYYHLYAVDLILDCLRKNHEKEMGRRKGKEKKRTMPYPYYDNKGILDGLEKWMCRRLGIEKLDDPIGRSFERDGELAGILATLSKVRELKKRYQIKEGEYYGSTPRREIDEKPKKK